MALYRVVLNATTEQGQTVTDALYSVHETGLEASDNAIAFLKENNPTLKLQVNMIQEIENGTLITCIGSQEYKVVLNKNVVIDLGTEKQ